MSRSWRTGVSHGAIVMAVVGTLAYFKPWNSTGDPAPAWSLVEIPSPPSGDPEGLLRRGEELFRRQCALCHGPLGKGDGPVSATYKTRPRDLTSGLYKLKSTPSGSMPSDADLFRTITAGVRSTAMRSYAHLSEQDRWALVRHLKRLARFEYRDDDDNLRQANPFDLHPPEPEIRIPEPPAFSTESIRRGAGQYRRVGCAACHGEAGKGDGPSAFGMKDDWGNAIEPVDLTQAPARRKGGPLPRDLFRVITVGVPGTPMPGLAASTEADRWDLVYYVWSLSSPTPPPSGRPSR